MRSFARLAGPVLWSLFALAAVGPTALLAQAEPPPAVAAARKLFAEGNWSGALEAFQKLSAEQPDNGMFHGRIGTCLLKLGRPAEAAAAFDTAAAKGAPVGFLGLDRALAWAASGNADRAFTALDELVAAGYSEPQTLRDHPGLAALQADARFVAAVTAADKNDRPCHYDPKARELDYWVGEWEVSARGAVAGHSKVERLLSDCVLLENWKSTQGEDGKSFNTWNREKGVWQQFWVDNRGHVLELEGQLEGGNMVYRGRSGPAENRDALLDRMTFFREGPDQVRQLWEQSSDGGKTWNTTFEGVYRRKVQ